MDFCLNARIAIGHNGNEAQQIDLRIQSFSAITLEDLFINLKLQCIPSIKQSAHDVKQKITQQLGHNDKSNISLFV